MPEEAIDNGQAGQGSKDSGQVSDGAPAPAPTLEELTKRLASVESSNSGLHQQIHERDGELARLREFETTQQADAKAIEDKRLHAAGEFDTLREKLEKENADLRLERDQERTDRLKADAMQKLAKDVVSENARESIARRWVAMDEAKRKEPDAWKTFVELERTNDPPSFELKLAPNEADRGGTPDQGGRTGGDNPLVVLDDHGHHDLQAMSKAIELERRKLQSG